MVFCYCFFFFKQKTAYEMRISDRSSDVCSSDLPLYVVDGVPMNNSTFDPINMAGAGGDSYSVRNLDFSSRGNDFNPEDIESITVLKGAAEIGRAAGWERVVQYVLI